MCTLPLRQWVSRLQPSRRLAAQSIVASAPGMNPFPHISMVQLATRLAKQYCVLLRNCYACCSSTGGAPRYSSISTMYYCEITTVKISISTMYYCEIATHAAVVLCTTVPRYSSISTMYYCEIATLFQHQYYVLCSSTTLFQHQYYVLCTTAKLLCYSSSSTMYYQYHVIPALLLCISTTVPRYSSISTMYYCEIATHAAVVLCTTAKLLLRNCHCKHCDHWGGGATLSQH